MAWLACDEDGQESIFDRHPERDILGSFGGYWHDESDWIELPKGSIKKLIGRELSWSDEPVEI